LKFIIAITAEIIPRTRNIKLKSILPTKVKLEQRADLRGKTT